MNKSHRPSLKPKIDLPSFTHSPIKKNKHNEDSCRKTTTKKVKELSFQGRPKPGKVKTISISDRKEKVRQSENKAKKDNNRRAQHSPSKSNKKTKRLSNNKRNKNQAREILRQKMLEEYLKSKFVINEKGKQICNQSTQFFLPLTHSHEKQNSVNIESQFLSSDESQMQQDVPSQFSVPHSYQKLHQENNLKQSRIISLEQWQNYQTLKLKNQQLTNYIEELQKIQKKLVQDKAKQEILSKQQSKHEREKLMLEYAQLNEKHMKVSRDNAVLQQMFNQGRCTVQALKNENASLALKACAKEEQAQYLKNSNLRLQNDSIQLKRQVFALKEALQILHCEKQQIEKKYDNVCLQKDNIKANAEEMLHIIKVMQKKHQN